MFLAVTSISKMVSFVVNSPLLTIDVPMSVKSSSQEIIDLTSSKSLNYKSLSNNIGFVDITNIEYIHELRTIVMDMDWVHRFRVRMVLNGKTLLDKNLENNQLFRLVDFNINDNDTIFITLKLSSYCFSDYSVTGECNICFNKNGKHPYCCNAGFICSECIMQVMQVKNKCPFCREKF